MLALLIPIPRAIKDGGTVHWDAALYNVYDVHRLHATENEDGTLETSYIEGIIVEVFGIEVFNNTEPRVNF
jgi:hypothetical protein